MHFFDRKFERIGNNFCYYSSTSKIQFKNFFFGTRKNRISKFEYIGLQVICMMWIRNLINLIFLFLEEKQVIRLLLIIKRYKMKIRIPKISTINVFIG